MTESLTVEQFYSEAKKSGKVLGLICNRGHVTVPARHSCRICGSTELTVRELAKFGKLVSFTEVYAKSKEFPLEVPYTLALVQLEDGGNLLGVLEGKASGLGIKVEISFKMIPKDSEQPRIFFQRI